MGLMLPFFLIAILGLIESVNLFNHYITVVNASRDGARLGSRGSITDDEIRSLIANDMDRLPGSFDAALDVSIDRAPVPGDAAIAVETCYDHTLILHIVVLMDDTTRVCSQTVMRMIPTPTP